MKEMLPFFLQKAAFYSSVLAAPALLLGTCININTASAVRAEADKTYVRPPVVLVYEDGSVEVWEPGKTRGSEKQLRKLVERSGRKVAQALFSNPQDEAIVKAKAAELREVFAPEKLSTFKGEVAKAAVTAQKAATEYVPGRESVQFVKSHNAWVYIVSGTVVESARGVNTSRKVSLKLGFSEPNDAEAKERPEAVLQVSAMEVSREAI